MLNGLHVKTTRLPTRARTRWQAWEWWLDPQTGTEEAMKANVPPDTDLAPYKSLFPFANGQTQR